jgi:hypothetical protein
LYDERYGKVFGSYVFSFVQDKIKPVKVFENAVEMATNCELGRGIDESVSRLWNTHNDVVEKVSTVHSKEMSVCRLGQRNR